MRADIRSIPADQTWPLRQRVFGPDQPMSQAMLDNDSDGQHLGVFVDDQLVTVASLFQEGPKTRRLRKLATLPDYQNLGLGSALLEHIVGQAEQDAVRVRCAVRTASLAFYRQFGFQPVGEPYAKGNHEHQVIALEPAQPGGNAPTKPVRSRANAG